MNAEGFTLVDCNYTLVTPVPCFVDERGEVWLERSWHHDFIEHLTYLRRLVLCAPRLPRGSEPDLVHFTSPAGTQVSFAFLPPQTSYLGALLRIPLTVLALWRAIDGASIVQSGISGWPYPLGWIANPLTLLRGKRLVVVVESDWRLSVPGRLGWKRRLVHMDFMRDWMARWSCNRAQLALFTQPRYRDALRTRNRESAYITPAVWINDEDILDAAAAEASWRSKVGEPVRILFAGRLSQAKGVQVLLEALRLLEGRRSEILVDIIGRGDMESACRSATKELKSVRLSMLEPVPYGKPFFEFVRGYHALVVPSLTSEQPRILFDANSQGVSVIASDTEGIRPHVAHGVTGILVPPSDVEALAAALEKARSSATELRALGMAALSAVRGMTHRAMHRKRSELLSKHCS